MEEELEFHENNLTCKDCINYHNCSRQIYREPDCRACTYEPSRFSTEKSDKLDPLDEGIRRIQNERPAWGED